MEGNYFFRRKDFYPSLLVVFLALTADVALVVTATSHTGLESKQIAAPQENMRSETSGQVSPKEKRASAFVPMRGRREDVDEDKRARGFLPMRGRKDEYESAPAQSPEDKRSMGFMPMRGRKSSYEGLDMDWLDKRAMGFVPVRGRKDEYDTSDEQDVKRAGFYGSRGKKDELEDLDKRAKGFMPMRGRKYDPMTSDDFSSDDKRAKGFMPMRGKKESLDEEKRGSGFVPMRGKRSMTSTIHESHHDNKRARSFMPSRGKRYAEEDDDFFYNDDEKRASFHAMRGKKGLSYLPPQPSGLVPAHMVDRIRQLISDGYALRRGGREGPKRAFYALRGKKSDVASYVEDLRQRYLDDADGSEMMDEEKRARGFMGMRGKRDVTHLVRGTKGGLLESGKPSSLRAEESD